MKKLFTGIAFILAILFITNMTLNYMGKPMLFTKNTQQVSAHNVDQLKSEIASLKSANNYERYIVKFKIKQTHLSLSIKKHLSDMANQTELEVPVDKAYYDQVNKGDDVSKKFRWGSLLLKGSIGSWDIRVEDKRIEK